MQSMVYSLEKTATCVCSSKKMKLKVKVTPKDIGRKCEIQNL